MSHCHFCTLLCELPSNLIESSLVESSTHGIPEQWECELREVRLAQQDRMLQRTDARLPRVDGEIVSIAQALKAAKEVLRLKEQPVTLITGDIHSVETSRAVIDFAAKMGAILDPCGSDAAFAQILAMQRHGGMISTFSEVRFRSDCILLIGDDSVLRSMPRLPSVLAPGSDMPNKRLVLMGNWSQSSIQMFQSLRYDVQVVHMDYRNFPRAIRDWSQLSSELQTQTESLASRWIVSAEYLALVWSPTNLMTLANDLWVEQVQEWIADQNSSRRVVGLPLGGSYQTFQQVATWITGFPGRMRLSYSEWGDLQADYRPHRFRAQAIQDAKPTPIVVRVDDLTLTQDHQRSQEYQNQDIHEVENDFIWIAPVLPVDLDQPHPSGRGKFPKVFLPCRQPFHECMSQIFRADSVFSVGVGSAIAEEKNREPVLELMNVSEILECIAAGGRA